MNATDIFLELNEKVKFDFEKNPFWWDGYGSFWVVIGAVLTQNTAWSGVERSLLNLKNYGVTTLEDFGGLSEFRLAELIAPSGFYNVKAKRLALLTKSIFDKFGDFENFKKKVSRGWLLKQNGLGFESADSILCYACEREVMVVDAYTNRYLKALDFEFESYDETAEWLSGFEREVVWERVKRCSDAELYARFHGLFVEFAKANRPKRASHTTRRAKIPDVEVEVLSDTATDVSKNKPKNSVKKRERERKEKKDAECLF